MKIRQIVETILSYHPFIMDYHGCDDYKCGDPEQECTGIVTAIAPTIDVIREAVSLGRAKAMISLGHFNWETLGMKYAAEWIGDLVPGIPVTYVHAGDMFSYFLSGTSKEGDGDE